MEQSSCQHCHLHERPAALTAACVAWPPGWNSQASTLETNIQQCMPETAIELFRPHLTLLLPSISHHPMP